MRPFDYAKPATPGGAVQLAQETGARFIAGGTNLLDLMKLDIEHPEHLVDITGLPLDRVIETPEAGLSIGALVTNSDLAAHAAVRRRYPVLARAILAGASAQIRNKASIGGNLLQRTRCFWFYDGASPCNKREPGSGCAAIGGFTRNNAILGASEHCIATHPSDMAVALLALDATVTVLGAGGATREIALADLYRLPGDTPHIETALAPGDLILDIELPAPPPGAKQIYRKVRDRASYAFALISVACVVAMAKGRISSVALAFGGLAAKPWRDREMEQALVGKAPTTEVFEAAADSLLANAQGQGANDFKIPLTRRTLIATLRDATGEGA